MASQCCDIKPGEGIRGRKGGEEGEKVGGLEVSRARRVSQGKWGVTMKFWRGIFWLQRLKTEEIHLMRPLHR